MSTPRSLPFVFRLATGDITQARATVLVVNHFNGMRPAGATAAVDAALGGAIAHRADRHALDAHLGASQFFPATSASLAASAVLVIGLGEAEKFAPERLPDVGAALVDQVAVFGIRDAASILHGAGGAGVEPDRAARAFAEGVLRALAVVPGAECFRELTIVEHDPDRVPAIYQGLQSATAPASIHVYVDPVVTRLPPAARGPAGGDGIPEHLRLGIAVVGGQVKVTVIGWGAFDCSSAVDYPAQADALLARLAREVLAERDARARADALHDIGTQLYGLFLKTAAFDVGARVTANQSGHLVLRLDQTTVHFPWELLCHQDQFLSRTQLLARQLEIYTPGRAAALRPARDRLHVLVVGNPTGDLPASRREAHEVADLITGLGGAVDVRVGDRRRPVTYETVSKMLNDEQYDVLHYAGHADFSPGRRGAGGLRLADGLLTPADLSTRRYLPRLVFANACSSAATDGASPASAFAGAEATRDLVRGLLEAGVQAFIGSQWPVADAAAGTFARAFYTTLLSRDGVAGGARTVGGALCAAREAVIADHSLGEPTWAAYALYGSPWALGF